MRQMRRGPANISGLTDQLGDLRKTLTEVDQAIDQATQQVTKILKQPTLSADRKRQARNKRKARLRKERR